ncbi:TonB-dependent receptor [Hymenobacter sp. BRD67]|uniref:TonB-dependent receptor n=1 Tax=Hymenobacter sp. BRD67 TaxID=2675877 RepID=UPI001563758E|nr:TonB-dependent receptor [Hymenobacter sp. BRD67]QKG53084.1 TonB-dependent receptor [Hymenobacter sp. BRD67]
MSQLFFPISLLALALPLGCLGQASTTPGPAHHASHQHRRLGTLAGRVALADGQSADHVSVLVRGTGYGAAPDASGNFRLTAPAGWQVVTFTGLGYAAQEITVQVAPHQVLTLPSVTLVRGTRQLDEVVVTGSSAATRPTTASKSGIAPLDLPQSVGVVSNTVLTDQQVNRLGDALRNVSGVALTQQRQGIAETFSARGFSIGISGAGGSIFKNGVISNTQGFPDASTLESIEVLKGSSALLYGNVSGGLIINMITKKPRFDWGGSVEMRAGSYRFYKPIVDIYGPISKNLAFRVVGTYENAKSYRDVVTSKRAYVNPSLLYKLGEKTDLLLQGDYLQSNVTPDAGVGVVNNGITAEIPANTPRSRFINAVWAYNITTQYSGSLVVNHRFNELWKLNAIAGWQDTRVQGFGVGVPSAIATNGDFSRTLSAVKTSERDFTGQLNLTGRFDTGFLGHQVLAGSDVVQIQTQSNTFRYTDAAGNVGPAYDIINILDRSKYAERTDIPTFTDTARTRTPSYRAGVYAQDLITLSPKFKVLAGLRWSYQKAQPVSVFNQLTQRERATSVEKVDKAFSPKAALLYQPLATLSFYGSYTNNFTINTGYDINKQALAPSIVDQYEAGAKQELFSGRVFTSLSVYRYRNSNLAQFIAFLPNGQANTDTNVKELTGQTTSDGLDVDVNASLSPSLYFNVGYGYNYNRYTNTSGLKGSQIEGERLTNNPANTANASVFYTFSQSALRGIKVGASAFYTGQRYGGNNNTVGQDPVGKEYSRLISLTGFTTIDLSAGYTYQCFSLLAKLSNITNELNYLVHDRYSINPIPPRQFLTTLGYTF